MKKIITFLFISFLAFSFSSYSQVAINSDGSAPDGSSMLDVKSNNTGILIPRMTATERDNINSPATGLLVYVTTDNQFYYFNGSVWVTPGGSDGDWTVNGNDMYSNNSGNVGIGTNSPSEKLEVNGSVKITDGSQADGRILVSDANGKASWQQLGYLPIYDELLPTESYEASISIAFFPGNAACLNSTYDGHTDWRIPTLHEAEYLTNLGLFGNVNAGHWTRTPDGAQNGNNRRYTTFNPSNDERGNSKITNREYLRCVR